MDEKITEEKKCDKRNRKTERRMKERGSLLPDVSGLTKVMVRPKCRCPLQAVPVLQTATPHETSLYFSS
jgi:hypothetical protein